MAVPATATTTTTTLSACKPRKVAVKLLVAKLVDGHKCLSDPRMTAVIPSRASLGSGLSSLPVKQ
jgi:hypothetical protein